MGEEYVVSRSSLGMTEDSQSFTQLKDYLDLIQFVVGRLYFHLSSQSLSRFPEPSSIATRCKLILVLIDLRAVH
jgi:hypothetical protein